MRPRSKSHTGVGSVTVALGLVALVVAIVSPAWSTVAFLGTPLSVLVATAGAVLLLAGGCVLVFAFREEPEEADFVRAHVAFNSRMNVPSMVPAATPAPRPITPLSPSPAPAQAPPSPSRNRVPAPVQPVAPRAPSPKDEIPNLDAQIRELTKNISKAGVMLATGQLSQQGYLAYVNDLKAQRARLEARRVRAELQS